MALMVKYSVIYVEFHIVQWKQKPAARPSCSKKGMDRVSYLRITRKSNVLGLR